MNEDIHKKSDETQKESSKSLTPSPVTVEEIPPLMGTDSDTTLTSPESITHGRPWGFWLSIAFGVAILLISFVIEAIASAAVIIVNTIVNEPSPDSQSEFAASGFVLSFASLIAAASRLSP